MLVRPEPSARARTPRTFPEACLLASLASLAACATTNPILAPARVLGAGHVNVDVGTAYQAPVVAEALSAAQTAGNQIRAGNDTPANRDALQRGAVAFANVAPGIASYVAVRAGFGNDVEGHAALVGRMARVGARRVFWHDADRTWVLSLGAQIRGAATPFGLEGTVPSLAVDAAWLAGGDVSAVIGRTNSDIYDVWIGLRAGYTHGGASLRTPPVNGGAAYDAQLDRADAALTLGVRVGFGRVAALAEIEAAVGYYAASASMPAPLSTSGAVFALTPAASLSFAF